jgi:RHS repeat-associated protein
VGHALTSHSLLIFLLSLSLSASQVAADDGIQTQSCKTCNQPPEHGKVMHSGSGTLYAYISALDQVSPPGTDFLGDKIGDHYWCPTFWAADVDSIEQRPEEWILTDITVSKVGNDWCFTYTLDNYMYDLSPGQAAAVRYGRALFVLDEDFFKCAEGTVINAGAGSSISAMGVSSASGGWTNPPLALCKMEKNNNASASSPGSTQLQTPPLSNAGADSSGGSSGGGSNGCSSCSQSGSTPGAFNITINLGNNGTTDVLWNYSGKLTQADLMSLDSFTSTSDLNMPASTTNQSVQSFYPGVTVSGDSMPSTVVVKDRRTLNQTTPKVVATTTFDYSYNATHTSQLDKLTITVTPTDTTQPVVKHTITRVTSPDGMMPGVQYTRAVTGGSTQNLAYYALPDPLVAATNRIQGVFRTVNAAGDTETLHVPSPSIDGIWSETNELAPADASKPKVTTVRSYRKIGTANQNLTVVGSEVVTQAGVTTTTWYGYDERPNFTNTQDPTQVYPNSNFGAQTWSATSDGAWNLTLLEQVLDPLGSGQFVYADSFTFEPWQNGPSNTPDMTNAGAVQSYFNRLVNNAPSSNYIIGGCKRTRTSDTSVQPGFNVSWKTRTITSICLEGGSTIDLGIEYSYGQGGSEIVYSDSLVVYRTSRSERWNAAGIADWSAAGAMVQWSATYGTTDKKLSLSVDQTGVAQLTVTNQQTDGSASQDVKKVQAILDSAGYDWPRTPANMSLGDEHPLWSTTTTDTQGRTLSETSKYSSAGTIIQTIGTTYTPGGGSTRSAGSVTLAYQSDPTTANGQTTTTSTDAQGISTVTVTNATTGDLISETRQGVTTSYSKVTDTAGNTTQTVTQSASGETTRTVSVTVTAPQGRTLSSTDANGGTTTFSYSYSTSNGLIVTEILPGNALPGGVQRTRITENYLDGQLKSITGTAVTPEFHTYTVNDGNTPGYESGSITKTVHYVTSDGLAWRKTTTNFLGQVLREEAPSPTLTGVSVTIHTYNDKGQRVKTTSPGMADLLTTYDEWGQVNQQGYDMDSDGALVAASTDVFTTSSTDYEQAEGTVLERVVRSQYTKDGDATTTLQTTTERKLLEGTTWQRTTKPDGTVITQSATITGTTRTVLSQQSVTGTQSQTQTYQNGLLTSETLPGMTSAVTYDYNGFGQTLHVVHPLNGTTTNTYDSATGNLHTLGQTGAGGTVGDTLTYVFNTRGLVDSVTHADPHTTKTSYTYDAQGRTLTQDGTAEYPLRYEYDAMGRQYKLHTYRSGVLGDVNSGDVTTWNYDPASGVLLSKADAAGNSVAYTYDAAGRVYTREWQRSRSDGVKLKTTYFYDDGGRLKSIDYNDGTPDVAHTYDRAGRRATTTDAAGSHTFTYDDTTTGGGQPATWSVTGSGAWSGLSVGYGRSGGRRSSRDTSLSSIALPGVSYTYDPPSGRVATVTASGIKATYRNNGGTGWNDGVSYTGGLSSTRTPDGLGRLGSVFWSAAGAVRSSHSYTLFDTQGRRKTAQRQNGSTWDYGYNDRGEVISAEKKDATSTFEPGKLFAFDYDGIGNRTSSSVSSLASTTTLRTKGYAANNLNQYSSITHPNPGWLVLRGSVLTAAGNSVTIDGNAPTLTSGSLWFYEQSVVNSSGPVRRVVDIAASSSSGGLHNARFTTHQKGALFIPPPSEVPTYDQDGNLTSDARWNYVWDGENRLIAQEEKFGIPVVQMQSGGLVQLPAASVTRKRLEFTYDAQGRRMTKRVLSATGSGAFVLQQSLLFLYDGWNMIAEIDTTTSSAQLLRSYEWGTDISGTMTGAGGVGGLLLVRFHAPAIPNAHLPSPGAHAPLYDGNGNVTELVDLAHGTISARYEYGAFGESISVDGGAVATANPFRFSTKYLDAESGFYNYGYRIYGSGRWLNRDPIEEQGGVNLYEMVSNDPVNQSDYLGLWNLPSNGAWDGEPGNSSFKPNGPYPPIPFENGMPDFKGVAQYRVTLPCSNGANRQKDVNTAIKTLNEMGTKFQGEGGHWHHYIRGGYVELQYVPAEIHTSIYHQGTVSAQGQKMVQTARAWMRGGGFGQQPGMRPNAAQTAGNAAFVAAMFADMALQWGELRLGDQLAQKLKQAQADCGGKAKGGQPGCCVVYLTKTWTIPAQVLRDGQLVPPSGRVISVDVDTVFFPGRGCYGLKSGASMVDWKTMTNETFKYDITIDVTPK